MSELDPIAELLSDLERHGRPALPWVVRWSADGRDPVLAAWEASRSPHAMFEIVKMSPSETFASITWKQHGRWLDQAFGTETGPDDDDVTYVIVNHEGLKMWIRRGIVRRWKCPATV